MAPVILRYSKQSETPVKIAGSFNDWVPQAMSYENGTYQRELELEPGKTYHYKFVRGSEWMTDSELPVIYDSNGNANHEIHVDSKIVSDPAVEKAVTGKIKSESEIEKANINADILDDDLQDQQKTAASTQLEELQDVLGQKNTSPNAPKTLTEGTDNKNITILKQSLQHEDSQGETSVVPDSKSTSMANNEQKLKELEQAIKANKGSEVPELTEENMGLINDPSKYSKDLQHIQNNKLEINSLDQPSAKPDTKPAEQVDEIRLSNKPSKSLKSDLDDTEGADLTQFKSELSTSIAKGDNIKSNTKEPDKASPSPQPKSCKCIIQ